MATIMPAESLPAERPTRFRWVIFALACATSWLLYLHRYTFALIKPYLQDEWQLTKADLGLLDGAFFFFYTTCQIPCGALTDAFGAHFALALMILVWSLFLALETRAQGVAGMRIALAGFGFGQAGVYAALNRITRTWFPFFQRTTVQGWVGVFFGRIGGLSASVLFATLLIGTLHIPWRSAILFLASWGVVLAIVFLVLFRDSPRRHPFVNAAEADLIEAGAPDARGRPRMPPSGSAAAPKPSLARLLGQMSPRSIANVLALTLQCFLSTLADMLYSNWIPLFLKEVHHLDYAKMGIYWALPLLGGALGGVAGGWLTDRAIRRTGSHRWSRSLVGLVGKGTAGVLLFVALAFYEHPERFCILLFVVKFFSDWSLAAAWGTVSDIGGNLTATVFAFTNSLASIASIVGPYWFGSVADRYGWIPVFQIVAVTYLLCAASWLLVNCTIPLLKRDGAEPEQIV